MDNVFKLQASSFMKPRRIVSTLCPKRLQPSDCVDISSRNSATVKLQSGASYIRYNKTYFADTFPPNTRGFFYYHTPPKAPPLVGELRFRCASNLDDFHNGKDLLSRDQLTPWSVPLCALANHVSYAKWREQLILDNLVTQATLDKWIIAKNVVKDTIHTEVGWRRPVLYYFTQPFFFRFHSRAFAFYTATKDDIGGCLLNNPMREGRHDFIIPYRGERSSWIRTYVGS